LQSTAIGLNVSVNGGTIQNTNAAGGHTIRAQGGVEVIGGKVYSASGRAIWTEGNFSIVTVARVGHVIGGGRSDLALPGNPVIYTGNATDCEVLVDNDGKVEAADISGIAIFSEGVIKIDGGEVKFRDGRGIYSRGNNVNVNINGGTVTGNSGSGINIGNINGMENPSSGYIYIIDGAINVAATGDKAMAVFTDGPNSSVNVMVLGGEVAGGGFGIYCTGSGDRVVINGGKVSNAAANANASGFRSAIFLQSSGTADIENVIVAGSGLVEAQGNNAYTYAIRNNSGSVVVTDNGVVRTTQSKAIYVAGSSATVRVEQQAQVNVTSGIGIYSAGGLISSGASITVNGGTVKAKEGNAITCYSTANVIVEDGLVFAYGSEIKRVGVGTSNGNPVVNENVAVAVLNLSVTNGTVIAWDKTVWENDGKKDYTLSSILHIDRDNNSTAMWAKHGGLVGIEYENSANTGFIVLPVAAPDMTSVEFNDGEFIYDGNTARSIYISGELPEGVSVSYEGNEKINAGEYTVRAKFSVDPEIYKSLSDMTAKIIINKAAGNFTEIPAIDTTYTPTLKLSDLTLPSGYAWVTPTTLLNAGNNKKYAATYTSLSGNYTVATGDVTVNVAKAAGTTVTVPALTSKTYNSITITAATAPANGQTVNYAINTDNIAPVDADDWQSELTFTGLSPETDYYIFARTIENANYNAGVISPALHVITDEDYADPIFKDKNPDRCGGIRLSSNIVSDKAVIVVDLPNNERVSQMKVVVYDNAGNAVFETETRGSKIEWNLTNNAGRNVANGMYLAVVEVKGMKGTVKVYTAKLGVKR
jgi:hypothetical protein